MARKEIANAIIKLKEMGHTGQEIIAFPAFIETHIPFEEEAGQAIEQDTSEQ